MSFIRGIRRKRSLAIGAVVISTAAGTTLLLTPQAKAAITPGTPQAGTGATQTVTVLPTAGLSITAPLVGTVGSPAGSAIPVGLGPVVVTDTEADASDWTASVAASDCSPVLSGNFSGATGSKIPATALSLTPGTQGQSQVSPTGSPEAVTGPTPAPAILGPGGAFQAVSQNGNAQVLAQTKVYQNAPNGTPTATDYYNNDGVYTFTPSLSVNTSGSNFAALATNYTCTLTYTVTG